MQHRKDYDGGSGDIYSDGCCVLCHRWFQVLQDKKDDRDKQDEGKGWNSKEEELCGWDRKELLKGVIMILGKFATVMPAIDNTMMLTAN